MHLGQFVIGYFSDKLHLLVLPGGKILTNNSFCECEVLVLLQVLDPSKILLEPNMWSKMVMWLVVFYSLWFIIFSWFPIQGILCFIYPQLDLSLLCGGRSPLSLDKFVLGLASMDFAIFPFLKIYIFLKTSLTCYCQNAKHSVDFGSGADCSICWFFLLLLQEVRVPCYILLWFLKDSKINNYLV